MKIVFATLLFSVALPVFAADGAADDRSTGAALSKVYEDRARGLLERYLPLKDFQVTAAVTPTKQRPRAPYDPKGLSPSLFSEMSLDELSGYVTKVQLEVMVSRSLTKSKKTIEEILFKTLRLKKERGDSVAFRALKIDVEPEAWTKEKAELRMELELARAEIERSKAEADRAKKEVKDQSVKPAPVPTPEPKAPSAPPIDVSLILKAIGGALGVGALLFLIAMLFIARGLSSIGKNVGGALSQAAELSSARAIGAGGGASNSENTFNQTLEAKMIAEKAGPSANQLPIDTAYAHLLKIRAEILHGLNESSMSIIMRHVTLLLAVPATVPRAVATFELLGKDVASEIFRRLPKNVQDTVLKFVRVGAYETSKAELMLAAGEDLKTKLLVESFQQLKAGPSEKVMEELAQLSDEDLAHVASTVGANSLPRLFLYLDAKKISNILAAMKLVHPEKYKGALSMLPKMADAENSPELDAELQLAIEAAIDRTRADTQRPFLKTYQEIIESVGDELGDEIVQELSTYPRLEQYLSENIITIHTFFRLTETVQREIIESLSNKDVAAFANGVKGKDKQKVLSLPASRRTEMIDEELETLHARGGNQAEFAFRRVRDLIVKRLKEMKIAGTLANAMVQTAAAASTAQKKPKKVA